MRNAAGYVGVLLLVVAALSIPADMGAQTANCSPGIAVRSPITGEIVDCLADGGANCLYCWDEIIVRR